MWKNFKYKMFGYWKNDLFSMDNFIKIDIVFKYSTRIVHNILLIIEPFITLNIQITLSKFLKCIMQCSKYRKELFYVGRIYE